MMEAQPRIGIFLCNCGKKLSEKIDFASVADSLRATPGVAFVEEAPDLCKPEGLARISERANEADRLVIAACSPRFCEEKFRAAAEDAGIDPELARVCNIREQCAWVMNEKSVATETARKIIAAALERARRSVPIERGEVEASKKVLVIGGGIAGIQSAIETVNFGYDVTLVEKSAELGGIVANLSAFYQMEVKPSDFIGVRIENLRRSEKVEALTGATVSSASGSLGNFDVRLDTSDGPRTDRFGAIVLATGIQPWLDRNLYGIEPGERFVTQSDFEKLLAEEEKVRSLLSRGEGKRKRVFILIGMGDEDATLSSANMLKYALTLRREFDCEVYVAARHVKVAAPELERMYADARGAGVVFFKFTDPSTISLSDEGGATVRILDPLLIDKDSNEYEIEVPCDLVILEESYSPDATHVFLQHTLGVRPGPRGFYQADNPHLGPVLTSKPGVFVAGSARGPMLIPEALVDAGAVASEVHSALSGGSIPVRKGRMQIAKNRCVLCLNCKRVCPHDAISYGLAAIISDTACQACGACAAVCPNLAISYTNETNEIYDIELESLV